MISLSRRFLRRVLRADSTLVTLPPGVGCCEVFRNFLSMEEEEHIYEEFSRVLHKEGQPLVLEGTTPHPTRIKHTYLEVFGEKDFTEVKNWNRKEVRRLPGLTWSHTLMRVIRDVDPPLLAELPDAGRILEHNLPGYEMHTEHPTVGSMFLYLSLLSDTVLEFDDEATERRGQVYLPARSLLRVSGEARWGFRYGESSEDVHIFRMSGGATKRVETDLRMSIQLWKLSPNLLDGRRLQEQLEISLEAADSKRQEERLRDQKEAFNDHEAAKSLTAPGENRFNIQPPSAPTDSMKSFMTSAMMHSAPGTLGGDLVPSKTSTASDAKKVVGTMQKNYEHYKKQFSQVQRVLQEMKGMNDAGQPVNDPWLSKKLSEHTSGEEAERDDFDPKDIEGTWDRADAKARFYKAQLKKMDYDGTAFLNSAMPDLSQEVPLDMRGTIRKIAPHVKDGEKILASLPNSAR